MAAHTVKPRTRRRRGRGTRLVMRARSVQLWTRARLHIRRHNRSLPGNAPTLNFYPALPIPRAHITRIVAVLGLRIDGALRPGEATIAWDGGTWFSEADAALLPPGTINGRCLDISKSLVDREWAAAAGYSIAVDPTTWDGRMVRKSELNGVHDGRVLPGPLPARRDGYVYQRYIDTVEGTSIIELRTVVIDGQIPLVIRRWRQAANWHAGSTRAELLRPEEAYSAEEIRHLLAFSAAMRLEYGELDVLRDRGSGLIYVIDANRTPSGPPKVLTAAVARDAAERMAAPFARLLAARWPEAVTAGLREP